MSLRPAAAAILAVTLGCAGPEALVRCRPGDGLLVARAEPPALEWRSPRTGRLLDRWSLPAAPGALAVTPRSSFALIALPAADRIATFDLVERAPGPLLELASGTRPIAVAAQRSGAALVLAEGTGELLALSLGGGAPVWRVPVGPRPRALVLDRKSGQAFVLGSDGAVRRIDARRGTLEDTLLVGDAPRACALDASASTLWLAGPNLHRLNVKTGGNHALASPTGPFQRIALDPSGLRAAVLAQSPPRLAVLSASTGRLEWERPLAEDDAGALLLDPWGRSVLFVSPAAGGVRVLDAEDGTPRGTIHIGGPVTALLWIHEDLRAFPFDWDL